VDEGNANARRPRAGQKTSQMTLGGLSQTGLKEKSACPNPPVLSCSSQADSTDACCVSLFLHLSLRTC
jgi:hypothetical protein